MKVSYNEGVQRGKEDRSKQMSYDPFRWIKAWAPNAWSFESGYDKGYNS